MVIGTRITIGTIATTVAGAPADIDTDPHTMVEAITGIATMAMTVVGVAIMTRVAVAATGVTVVGIVADDMRATQTGPGAIHVTTTSTVTLHNGQGSPIHVTPADRQIT